MNEQRNLLFAVLISVGIFMGWDYFYNQPQQEILQQQQAAQKKEALSSAPIKSEEPPTLGDAFDAPPVPVAAAPQDVEAVLEKAPRVMLETAKVRGSINLRGGQIDDLTLLKYQETPDPQSANLVLLSPLGTENPYYAEFGWLASDRTQKMPDRKTIWQPVHPGQKLTEKTPVELMWDNGQGLVFKKTISIDDQYLFKVTQTVENRSEKPLTFQPYSMITRVGTPETLGFFILHEGPIGYMNGQLKEFKYDALKEKRHVSEEAEGGWIGITDKYLFTALVPDVQSEKVEHFFQDQGTKTDYYQVGYRNPSFAVAPGQSTSVTSNFFAGAKVLSILDHYESQLGVAHFDLAIDFGWFYFITKPFFYFLDFLNSWLGNFGLGILVFTVLLKLAFFPLANKSYRSMARMKLIQPKVKNIQERFGEDKMKMNQEIMELYRREKVNPMAGCLPILLQIPVFFALYKVLFVSIEMRHAPFYGWIQDLSAPDPTTLFNLFGLIPWDPPSFLQIGVWPLLMGVTMVIQQRLNPPPADPVQARMFMIMPIVFTIMLASFPAGLVIYWAWSNLLSIAQQWMIMRMAAKEPTGKKK